MDEATRKRLEAAGFVETTAEELLGLSPAESALVEIKLALSNRLRRLREEKGLTQEGFGKEIGTTQSRVARMENADGSVDLLFGALLEAGATREELAEAVAGREAV
jgi:DNA-binding transcriptional regulator YiaG